VGAGEAVKELSQPADQAGKDPSQGSQAQVCSLELLDLNVRVKFNTERPLQLSVLHNISFARFHSCFEGA